MEDGPNPQKAGPALPCHFPIPSPDSRGGIHEAQQVAHSLSLLVPVAQDQVKGRGRPGDKGAAHSPGGSEGAWDPEGGRADSFLEKRHLDRETGLGGLPGDREVGRGRLKEARSRVVSKLQSWLPILYPLREKRGILEQSPAPGTFPVRSFAPFPPCQPTQAWNQPLSHPSHGPVPGPL